MSVWTKTGHGLLPKTNSEYSQMDFPLQSRVNERKQGGASQGLHCDSVDRSTFNSLIEGNLQEFGPDSYLSVLVRDGNPRLGYIENSGPASTFSLIYERMSDNAPRYTFDSEATLPNLTFSWCQLHLMFFLFCSTISWNALKIKSARCSQRSEISEIYCWSQVNSWKKCLHIFFPLWCIHVKFSRRLYLAIYQRHVNKRKVLATKQREALFLHKSLTHLWATGHHACQ